MTTALKYVIKVETIKIPFAILRTLIKYTIIY